MGAGCLSDKWMKDLLVILEKNLNAHFENEIQRYERRKDEDYDEVCIRYSWKHFYNCCLHVMIFRLLKRN